MEETEKMKFLLIPLSMLFCGLLSGGSYAELKNEADNLAAAKDIPRALEKYAEAQTAAAASGERLICILERYKLLISAKRREEAAALLKSHLEDEKLADPELRHLVNTYASQIMWGSEEEKSEALALLSNAQLLKTTVQYDFFSSFYLAAHIYAARKNHEAAITLMRTVLDRKRMHPAILYSAALLSGQMYEKLGRKQEAQKHYEKALEYGRKVTYKFDYTPAQRAVERLSK